MVLKFTFPIALFILLFSCKQADKPSGQETVVSVPHEVNAVVSEDIEIATAKEWLKSNKNIVIIDVRTPQEITAGKIDGALEFNLASPDFQNNIASLDKNKEYIVYCAVGGRSARAVKMMKELGFEKAYNLKGGYNLWQKN